MKKKRTFNLIWDFKGEFLDSLCFLSSGLRNIQQLTDTYSRMRYFLGTNKHENAIGTYEGFRLLGEDYTLYFEEDITGKFYVKNMSIIVWTILEYLLCHILSFFNIHIYCS
jgi:hypothetical protein